MIFPYHFHNQKNIIVFLKFYSTFDKYNSVKYSIEDVITNLNLIIYKTDATNISRIGKQLLEIKKDAITYSVVCLKTTNNVVFNFGA